MILQEEQKYEEALPFCNEGIIIEPRNIELLLNRSNLLIKTRRYDEAIQDCNQVINIDEGNALAYYNKGCARALMSNGEEAISLIRKAITLDSTFHEKAKLDPDLAELRKTQIL